MPIKHGDTVTVDFTGRLADGTVIADSKKKGKPFVFEIGSDRVPPGMEELIDVFEEALIGLEIDQEKEIVIDFNDYNDPYDKSLVRKMPIAAFPEDRKPIKGTVIDIIQDFGFIDQRPWSMAGIVTEVGEDHVIVNMNFPLAGKKVIYRLKVKDIKN